jgi:hypothetical protein
MQIFVSLKPLLLGAALAIVCVPAAFADTPPPQTPATTSDNSAQNPQQKADEDKVVCRKEPPPVGSRLGGRKVCRTVKEWRRIDEDARAAAGEMQQQGRGDPPKTE